MTSPLTRALETTKLGLACLTPTIRPIAHEGFRERLDDKQKNKRSHRDSIKQNSADFATENVDADDSLGSKYAKSREPEEQKVPLPDFGAIPIPYGKAIVYDE